MRKFITLLSALLISTSTQAAGHVGQCVFPKTEVAKDGRLKFKKDIVIYASPKEKKGEPLKVLTSFKVRAEDGALIQLVEAETGKIFGWGSFKDFDFQDLRNCNL
jgi:hypothetical protein